MLLEPARVAVRHRRSRSCWKTTDASSPVGELLVAPSYRCSVSNRPMWLSNGRECSSTMGQCCLSLHVSQCATAVRARAGKQQTHPTRWRASCCPSCRCSESKWPVWLSDRARVQQHDGAMHLETARVAVRHRPSRSCWKTTDASSPVGELLAAPSCRCSESKWPIWLSDRARVQQCDGAMLPETARVLVRHRRSRSCWKTTDASHPLASFLLPHRVAVRYPSGRYSCPTGRECSSMMGQCCLSRHVSQCATAVRARAGKQQTHPTGWRASCCPIVSLFGIQVTRWGRQGESAAVRWGNAA